MSINIMPVSDLRREINVILLQLSQPIYVTQRGRVKAVLLDIEHYNDLMDQLDDLHAQCDPEMRKLAEAAHTAHQRGETEPFDQVLREDGL